MYITPKYENYSGNIMKWKPQHTIDVYVDENNILDIINKTVVIKFSDLPMLINFVQKYNFNLN
jgi:hypothetical protein